MEIPESRVLWRRAPELTDGAIVLIRAVDSSRQVSAFAAAKVDVGYWNVNLGNLRHRNLAEYAGTSPLERLELLVLDEPVTRQVEAPTQKRTWRPVDQSRSHRTTESDR